MRAQIKVKYGQMKSELIKMCKDKAKQIIENDSLRFIKIKLQ